MLRIKMCPESRNPQRATKTSVKKAVMSKRPRIYFEECHKLFNYFLKVFKQTKDG